MVEESNVSARIIMKTYHEHMIKSLSFRAETFGFKLVFWLKL